MTVLRYSHSDIHKPDGIASHPVLIHLAHQICYQVGEHGIQNLHTAGGGGAVQNEDVLGFR